MEPTPSHGSDPNQVLARRSTLAPLLSVRRGKAALAFYTQAFGARIDFQVESDSGEVVAKLSMEGSEFWVADESPAHQNFSPETLGGGTVRMVWVVENPEQAFQRALSAGAKEVWPVQNQHGWILGRLVDPFGHHWEIGKPISDPQPS